MVTRWSGPRPAAITDFDQSQTLANRFQLSESRIGGAALDRTQHLGKEPGSRTRGSRLGQDDLIPEPGKKELANSGDWVPGRALNLG